MTTTKFIALSAGAILLMNTAAHAQSGQPAGVTTTNTYPSNTGMNANLTGSNNPSVVRNANQTAAARRPYGTAVNSASTTNTALGNNADINGSIKGTNPAPGMPNTVTTRGNSVTSTPGTTSNNPANITTPGATTANNPTGSTTNTNTPGSGMTGMSGNAR